ncbi:MAG: glutamine synthetase family protein [Bacteroidales bacterium]|jgi:glutamine synthetase|nr:glutamine synthetase family protein [Bacteroidales bacterium]
MKKSINLNPNPLIRFLQKPNSEFTREDIIHFITHHEIEMVNFRYVGADGRLKTLNFYINSLEYLENILSFGERVDGSSLFPYIPSGESDLYVIPRFRTAFVNPFSAVKSLDILCNFYTKEGKALDMAPERTLHNAHKNYKELTGMEFHAMGELEYYVIQKVEEPLFEAENQKGYHESTPFCKFEYFRTECMQAISKAGGQIKYGHSEVGNFKMNDFIFEQNEIEFLPVDVEDAADQLLIAKWIIRTLAYKHNFDITFSPKITVGKAGSGMHIHTKVVKNGKNQYIKNGKLTDTALKTIAGFLDLAPALTSFGNTVPTSYLRLVPHQEAPTNICWGDRNRAALIRVPLGWVEGAELMISDVNPLEIFTSNPNSGFKQTIEFRCPDGSADIYLLLASIVVAARHGYEMKNAVEYAKERFVSFKDKNTDLSDMFKHLPDSCCNSALALEEQRHIFEKYNVFSPILIDGTIAKLKAFNDQNLREELNNDEEKILNLVRKYQHAG